jgi:FKBP-type peptidyl-prolyl cis-trans isomerase 2
MKKRCSKGAIIFVFLAVAMPGIQEASYSSDVHPVQEGEEVRVQYTCRLKDGPVVTTSEGEVAEKAKDESRIFMSRKQYAPLRVRAGYADPRLEDPTGRNLKGLLEEVEAQLSENIVGRPMHERFTIELNAEPQRSVPVEEGMIWMSRARKIPRSLRIARSDYMAQTGASEEPVVGGNVNLYTGMKGKIVSVTADEVMIEFTPQSDKPFESVFGERTVVDVGTHYVLRTETQEGQLVKTGPLLGRVVKVLQGQYLLDYSHPFGGEALTCDVIVEPVPTPSLRSASAVATPRQRSSVDGIALDEKPKPVMPGEETASMSDPSEDAVHNPKVNLKTGEDKDELNAVAEGDLVEVHYTVSLENGTVVRTTVESIAEDPEMKKSDEYRSPDAFGPELIAAGGNSSFPGLGRAVLGMEAGEKKQWVLPPEKAYGPALPQRVKEYSLVNRIPKTRTMTPKEWADKFKTFPVAGDVYEEGDYVRMRVTGVDRNGVTVEISPKAEKIERSTGTVTAREQGDEIVLAFEPKLGAPYVLKGIEGKPVQGRIVKSNEEKYTVDFNHPLAGKSLILDIEVVSVTKASELPEITWIENHDRAVDIARKEGKLVVLVLYADWCSWSKKLLNESFRDPRVKIMKDRVIWAKVNSQNHRDLYQFYEQTGFPLTVLLNSEGDVIKKINGFREGGTLMKEIEGALTSPEAENI